MEDGVASSKGLYLFGGDKYSYSVKVYSETAQKFHFTLLTIDEVTREETTVELDSKNVKAGEWTELKGDRHSFRGKLRVQAQDLYRFN